MGLKNKMTRPSQASVDIGRVLDDYGIVRMRVTEMTQRLKAQGKVDRTVTDAQLSRFLAGTHDLQVGTIEVLELAIAAIEPAAIRDLFNRRQMRLK